MKPSDHKIVLSTSQTSFAEYVLAGKSLKEAAILAGYSPKTVSVKASQLMRHPAIVAYIERRRAAAAARNDVTLDEIIGKFRHIRDASLQAEPVMVKRGREMVQLTQPAVCCDCGKESEPCSCGGVFLANVYGRDNAAANTANTQLGRTIAAFVDKSDTVSEEVKRQTVRMLHAQAEAMGKVLRRRLGIEGAEECKRELEEETKLALAAADAQGARR